MRKTRAPVGTIALALFVFQSGNFLCSKARAQAPAQDSAQTAIAGMTDAPGISSSSEPQQAVSGTQSSAAQPPPHVDPQPKRIFGILPNFRAVTAGTKLPEQTVKDKFVTSTEDSFDYSAVLLAALVASEAYAANDTPEFHSGFPAYGRYFWHTYVDQTSENYFVEFIIPVMTHEDTRFYSLGKGGFGQRLGYALSRAVITKTDSGKATFNAGEVIGAGASAGISNFYYPRPERTVSNTVDKWATNVGIDAISFVVKEFYPDIYHAFFHRKIEPQTIP